MIGYYIHHQGSGHLHRAIAITESTDVPVTGLSTKSRPAGWRGDWVQLPDDAGAHPDQDLTAGGRLHYAPVNHRGLRARMSQIAAWIDQAHPAALIVDVSVEVALLARLHGVPIISMGMPGLRNDSAHRLGYDISQAILAPWPAAAAETLWQGVDASHLAKTQFVGSISRFRTRAPGGHVPGRVVVLNGTGGTGPTAADLATARTAAPGWEWIHLDRASGTWLDDPWPMICSASVIVSHTGQNAVAEIAAARRPAVLIPQDRPFDEQRMTASALRTLDWVPALVRDGWPHPYEWQHLLGEAERLDGSRWSGWNDGCGAERAAAVVGDLLSAGLRSVPA